jgi:hypothetical protein
VAEHMLVAVPFEAVEAEHMLEVAEAHKTEADVVVVQQVADKLVAAEAVLVHALKAVDKLVLVEVAEEQLFEHVELQLVFAAVEVEHRPVELVEVERKLAAVAVEADGTPVVVEAVAAQVEEKLARAVAFHPLKVQELCKLEAELEVVVVQLALELELLKVLRAELQLVVTAELLVLLGAESVVVEAELAVAVEVQLELLVALIEMFRFAIAAIAQLLKRPMAQLKVVVMVVVEVQHLVAKSHKLSNAQF